MLIWLAAFVLPSPHRQVELLKMMIDKKAQIGVTPGATPRTGCVRGENETPGEPAEIVFV